MPNPRLLAGPCPLHKALGSDWTLRPPHFPLGSPATAGRPVTASPSRTKQRIRSEEHTSELQSLMRISYAVFCLKKNKQHTTVNSTITTTRHNLHINKITTNHT